MRVFIIFCFSVLISTQASAQKKNRYYFQLNVPSPVDFYYCILDGSVIQTHDRARIIGVGVDPMFEWQHKSAYSAGIISGWRYNEIGMFNGENQASFFWYSFKGEIYARKYFGISEKPRLNGFHIGLGVGTQKVYSPFRMKLEQSLAAHPVFLYQYPFNVNTHLGFNFLGKGTKEDPQFGINFEFHFCINQGPYLFIPYRTRTFDGSARYYGNYLSMNLHYGFGLGLKHKRKDPTPKLKGDQVPVIAKERAYQTNTTLTIKRRKVKIWLWDFGVEDHDTVSLQLNNNIILENYALVREKKKIKVLLQPGENNLIMIAHNEGDIPPNTAEVVIQAGRRKYKVILNSSMKHNEGLKLIYAGD